MKRDILTVKEFVAILLVGAMWGWIAHTAYIRFFHPTPPAEVASFPQWV